MFKSIYQIMVLLIEIFNYCEDIKTNIIITEIITPLNTSNSFQFHNSLISSTTHEIKKGFTINLIVIKVKDV